MLIAEGAVYNPFTRLPIEGFMDQVTEEFALPVTVAVNCLVCDAVRVAVEGLTPTLIPGDVCPRAVMVPMSPLAAIDVPAEVDATTLVI